ncbi:ATP-grasp domain-containing protein [Pseudarthrobacter sp. BIM B-2242]|uniref:ATP-grasp domain-containing protein n=1 Tax=Pseudarthrobacter sp. BIM B-2242 TaxID=2772401 RepID=UPI001CC6F489|nr:ATP-grasp domain-containing protein [Pseudarthrobacter sp. BIM B-2242]
MTSARLLVLGDSHPPEAAARHLASSGMLPVEAGTSNRVPETMEGTALWVDTSGATRLLNAGLELPLLSPGSAWLSTVPGYLLGRRVLCTTLGQLQEKWRGPGLFRLAEQQYAGLGFPTFHADPATFVAAAGKYHYRALDLVAELNVVVSAPVDYVDEYRVFVADGEISASTRVDTRLRPGKRTDAYEGDEEDRTAAALHFAQIVLDATVWHQPPGFRIDVGLTADGSWQLISAGPSWAAQFHLANPSGVLASVLSGQAPDYDHWKWVPDELFQQRIFRAWPAA